MSTPAYGDPRILAIMEKLLLAGEQLEAAFNCNPSFDSDRYLHCLAVTSHRLISYYHTPGSPSSSYAESIPYRSISSILVHEEDVWKVQRGSGWKPAHEEFPYSRLQFYGEMRWSEFSIYGTGEGRLAHDLILAHMMR